MYIYLHYRPGDKKNVNIFTFGSPVSAIVPQEPKSINIYTGTVVI